jgi:hypothetical protein
MPKCFEITLMKKDCTITEQDIYTTRLRPEAYAMILSG